MRAQDRVREKRGRGSGIVGVQLAPGGQLRERLGKEGQCSRRSAVPVCGDDAGESQGLGDGQPPQLHDGRVEHAVGQGAGDRGQPLGDRLVPARMAPSSEMICSARSVTASTTARNRPSLSSKLL